MNRPDDEIFSDALDLPLAERAAFLDRACADDPAQRVRVEALLAADAVARADFLAQPAVPRPESPEEKIGDRIGAYALVRRVGEGGCGVVYLAEQTEPLRRHVALKVIKLGMDTREVIARFEAERQALALMDHPCIARVFDAGATATGRPFFAMEFVDGLPITRFCDEHRLTTEQRLDLFARVCLAIQHAHQKGIIHRDVKPSNILVAMHDGTPMPKVIDFGIAKATQGRLAQHTLVTQLDQLVGTPAYMSPEQVEARDLDIDTRSDVYSLGVLLYELLAGRPPYDPQSLLQAGVAEIRRIIREVDPPRPSTRLATLAAVDRDTVARLRGAASVQLTSVLRGDLDWIVMRCLEKDRARRYGTAHELAEDVRRHLRCETVTARPPDALYRTRKFVSRHRLAVGASAAVALSLVAGTIVSLVQADRARRAEAVARAERDTAQAAQRAEAVARADAQRRQEQAESLLTFMLGDFRSELKKIGKLSLLDAVGDKAMAHFAALDPKDLTDTALNQQARALTQIGEIRLDEARYDDAVRAFETAYQRTAALVTRHPANADMLFERAQAEFWIGFAARRRGDFATTRAWLTRYRDSALALHALEGPTRRAIAEVVAGRWNLAVADYDANELAAAEQGFRAEREILGEQLASNPTDSTIKGKLAEVIGWLGSVSEKDGRYREALRDYSDMAARLGALRSEQSAVAKWSYRLAECHGHIARVLSITGQPEEAMGHLEEAIGLLSSDPLSDPGNQQWSSVRLTMQLERDTLLAFQGRPRTFAAIRMLRLQIDELVVQQPKSRPLLRCLALALFTEARSPECPPNEGLDLTKRAISLLAPLTAGANVDSTIEGEFARACLLNGRIEERAGHTEISRRSWLQVVTMFETRATSSRDWRVLDPLAQALVLLGREDSARPLVATLKRCGYRPIDPDAASTLRLNP
ncbi:MAG: serine/threonine protein kinase [Opitutae bacterium]|nr:serine/threonine protein kinase [Opitutae bacterium]